MALSPLWEPTLLLSKTIDGQEGRLLINKDWTQPREAELIDNCEICRPVLAEGHWSWEPASGRLELAPAEIVLIRRNE